MSENGSSRLPFAVLQDFISWLRAEGVPGIVIGGVAASILGRPRVTRDIDGLIIIDVVHLENFISNGTQFGFIPRIKDILVFAHKNSINLLSNYAYGFE